MIAVTVPLTACDNVPDTLNPFAEEKTYESQTPIDTSKVPGGDEPYPNLSTVPERPEPNLSEEQRRTAVEGLISDRDNAVYSDGTGPGRYTKPGEAPEVDPARREQVVALQSGPAAAEDAAKLGAIVFASDSADLPPDAETLIRRVAETQKATSGTIQVIGHAGGKLGQDRQALVQLAAGRARTIAVALIREGVPRDAVVTSVDATKEATEEAGGTSAEIYLSR